MCPEEQLVRSILKETDAQFVRKSSNGHEVWRLHNGNKFICDKRGRGKARGWRNNLALLRRQLNKHMEEINQEKTMENHQHTEQNTSYNNKRIIWTEEQDKQLISLAQGGMNSADIAASMQELRPSITSSSVANRLARLRSKGADIPRLRKPRNQNGTKRRSRGKKAPRWTSKQDMALLECWNAQLTLKEIHEYMKDIRPQVSEGSISARINKLRHEGWTFKERDSKTLHKKPTPTPNGSHQTLQPKNPPKQPNGYELILRFPDGSETKTPISESNAQEWALKILNMKAKTESGNNNG